MSPDTKALRRYHAAVERALGLFDASNEWADYIAFLSRLLKALQTAPQDADVPLNATLAKYLAQCLRPSLPAGVHQKALETYGVVFSLLGQDGLSKDLSLYLPGVSHTLSFASLSTRPWFLSLYDEHILKLPPSVLRPALKAIILSLLPGIEEENSDDFERTLATLNRLRASFAAENAEDVFWQSLFLASMTSPNRRMGVLIYLVRYLPRLQPTSKGLVEDALQTNSITTSIHAVTTPEPGLLIRCFATGLQDEQPLVQRGFLDLLVTHLPLQAETLQQSSSSNDLDILVSAAMSIVLRRDMSLNRRLWSWYFGQAEKSGGDATGGRSHQTDDGNLEEGEMVVSEDTSGRVYFSNYGLVPIIRTFRKMLDKKPPSPIQRARPFRILISLMDRSSIGRPVVEELFESILQDLRLYQTNAPSQSAFDEVFRSANVFFDSAEPHVIASNIIKLFDKNNLDLIEFIAINFNLEDDEMTANHIPSIILVLSQDLIARTPESANREQIARVMNLLLPIASTALSSSTANAVTASVSVATTIDGIRGLYLKTAEHATATTSPPIELILSNLLENISQAIVRGLRDSPELGILDHLTSIFDRLCRNFSVLQNLPAVSFIDELLRWAANPQEVQSTAYGLTRNISVLVTTVLSQHQDNTSVIHDIFKTIPPLIMEFWRRLSPSTPQYHVECVESIWTLRSLSANTYIVDSTILSLLSQSHQLASHEEHPVPKFGTLWTHTKLPVHAALTVNGHVPRSDTDPVAFFRTAMLYVLDAADLNNPTDPGRTWMSTLPSLSLHFRAVLEGIEPSQADSQETITNMLRLRKLVDVAKASPSLWKEFASSQGSALPALARLTSIMVSSADRQNWAIVSLSIIRSIHQSSDTLFDESLVETLTKEVTKGSNSSGRQSALLETLQLLLTLRSLQPPPLDLLQIVMFNLSSTQTDTNLDKWITLLCNGIPLYSDSVLFASLLKLTESFCKRIQAYFEALQSMYDETKLMTESAHVEGSNASNPERSITNLLSGLEYILARAHTKINEAARPSSGARDGQADVHQPRAVANNRLTAVLCMQDSIKVCGQLWHWRPPKKVLSPFSTSKSFNYMSSRLRSRTRRMLEHLIQAEPQECLETLMGMWVDAGRQSADHSFVMNLLESLDGARPKFMMPAIFNAIYGRTNPGALDVDQRSSLSIDISALEVTAFLTDYVEALEDDLLEEIWSDCTSFLRDILANPMPHRQILLRLLEFLAILCKKMENTNFGDQFRMRRELADVCARLFTAIFTIKPGGFDQSSGDLSKVGKAKTQATPTLVERFQSGSGIEIICRVLPSMTPVLIEADRASTIHAGISANITGPLLRSRHFPSNVTGDVLDLLLTMSKTQNTAKVWKKDLLDAFNDVRFFQSTPDLAEAGWVPITRQLASLDKTLVTETLSKLAPPATAGIMFGVGATAARAEADKQAKGNLRRIALLLVASDIDSFLSTLGPIVAKVEELLTASPTTSPSSSTRGDIFLLLRAIVLSMSQDNVASLWPIIDAELRGVFEDLTKTTDSKFTPYSHMQAAKLLDLLLLVKPEEFQLHEWLYVTDTMDAIYPPLSLTSTALADQLALEVPYSVELQSSTADGGRKPWLCTDPSRKADEQEAILGSFFTHLSIRAFEDTYSLDPVDYQACRRDVLADLFTIEEGNHTKERA